MQHDRSDLGALGGQSGRGLVADIAVRSNTIEHDEGGLRATWASSRVGAAACKSQIAGRIGTSTTSAVGCGERNRVGLRRCVDE